MKADQLDAISKVMIAISKHRKEAGSSIPLQGALECPLCEKGMVRWIYRGPRSAIFKCDTEGCLEGMA